MSSMRSFFDHYLAGQLHRQPVVQIAACGHITARTSQYCHGHLFFQKHAAVHPRCAPPKIHSLECFAQVDQAHHAIDRDGVDRGNLCQQIFVFDQHDSLPRLLQSLPQRAYVRSHQCRNRDIADLWTAGTDQHLSSCQSLKPLPEKLGQHGQPETQRQPAVLLARRGGAQGMGAAVQSFVCSGGAVSCEQHCGNTQSGRGNSTDKKRHRRTNLSGPSFCRSLSAIWRVSPGQRRQKYSYWKRYLGQPASNTTSEPAAVGWPSRMSRPRKRLPRSGFTFCGGFNCAEILEPRLLARGVGELAAAVEG